MQKNATLINGKLNIARITHLNPALQNKNVTIINQALRDIKAIVPGIKIDGRYLLGEPLDVVAGEADIYSCVDATGEIATNLVAKIYRRDTSIDMQVLGTVSKLESEYVAKCYAIGEICGRPYEIVEFYEEGSVLGKKYSYDELKNTIIPALNEGLKALHEKSILHKDLKPSNIMISGKTVSIIDFGISSIMEEGVTMLIDKTGLTPTYSAPETFRDIFLRESDYYSLGITIYELFTGHTPYAGLTNEEMERLVSVQKIPLPDDMPIALQDLITGLTYSDISNRKDKTNPNRRWTYDEVLLWLKGEKQPIPGKSRGVLEHHPYVFLDEPYDDLEPLVDALASNWEAGKNELYRGKLTSYFETVSIPTMEICIAAENRASTLSGKDDLIFWETLYKLAPDAKRLYWKGEKWENLPSLGRDILDDEKNGGSRYIELASELIEQGVINKYISMLGISSFDKQMKLLNELSSLYMESFESKAEREKYVFELGYLLSGQVVLNIDGRSIFSLRELREYMMELYAESYDKLKKFCSTLIDNKQELKPRFEVWLLALGKRKELNDWKREFGLISREEMGE